MNCKICGTRPAIGTDGTCGRHPIIGYDVDGNVIFFATTVDAQEVQCILPTVPYVLTSPKYDAIFN